MAAAVLLGILSARAPRAAAHQTFLALIPNAEDYPQVTALRQTFTALQQTTERNYLLQDSKRQQSNIYSIAMRDTTYNGNQHGDG